MKKFFNIIRRFLPEGDFETYTPEKFDMLGFWFCIIVAVVSCVIGHYTRWPLAFFVAGYAVRSSVKPTVDPEDKTPDRK